MAHHSSRRPSYRFHPVLPLTLPFALVQQQKETYHIHVFSSPLYSSVWAAGAFSIISSLRSSGATNGTRIQNCTWTSTLLRICWVQKASLWKTLNPDLKLIHLYASPKFVITCACTCSLCILCPYVNISLVLYFNHKFLGIILYPLSFINLCSPLLDSGK